MTKLKHSWNSPHTSFDWGFICANSRVPSMHAKLTVNMIYLSINHSVESSIDYFINHPLFLFFYLPSSAAFKTTQLLPVNQATNSRTSNQSSSEYTELQLRSNQMYLIPHLSLFQRFCNVFLEQFRQC
jgi:hypothetical protein